MLKISNANCTLEELYTMFSRFGRITMNCVRGYAVVRFEDDDTAKRAMKNFNGYVVNKKKLVIRPYRGGPVQQEDPEVEAELTAGEQHANKLAQSAIDRIHEEALNRIKDFRPKLEDIIRHASEGIETALKNSLESMIVENISEEEQKIRVDEYCSMYEKEVSRLTQRYLQPNLSKMVKRLATFDKKSINLEQPVEHVSLHHLVTEEARAMEVRKPFYETASCGSVKKMIAVSDSNFIAGFSGSPCLKYYRNDDYKPIFSTQITAPSALATYSKQGRHYCIYGDASGRLGVVKIDTFEKEYDEFNMHKNIITDIKHHRENRFLSCSSDGTIRAWKVDEQERMQGQYSLEVIKTDEYYGEGTLASMDVLNDEEMVLGLCDSKIIVLPMLRTRTSMISLQPHPVLKVSRQNDRLFWACMNTTIKLLDTRCFSDETVFDSFGEKLRAFSKLSEHIFAYGGETRVGLGDRRYNKSPLWKDDDMHTQDVRDLVNLGRNVYSCGMDGRIVKWAAL